MSTDVNSYQQLSTKGLYGNFSNIRHTQVVLTLKIMSTLSTDINNCQRLSTEASHINISNMGHTLKGLATENYVNTVNRGQHSVTATQQGRV